MKTLTNWIKLLTGNFFRCTACHQVKDNYDSGVHISDENGYRIWCKECAKTEESVIRSLRKIIHE